MYGIRDDEWYKPREIADVLKMSKRWVLREIERGTLPAIRLGRERRVLGRDLRQHIMGARGCNDGDTTGGDGAEDDAGDEVVLQRVTPDRRT
jgi:excisionase family DNA binding protein